MTLHTIREAKQPLVSTRDNEETASADAMDHGLTDDAAMSIGESTLQGDCSDGDNMMEAELSDGDNGVPARVGVPVGSNDDPSSSSIATPSQTMASAPVAASSIGEECGMVWPSQELINTGVANEVVEPVRWLLHGKPGAGKSHAIIKLKLFFEEATKFKCRRRD